MPPASDWRSATSAKRLMSLDRGEFAVEFLRRNPSYQEDYRRTHERIASGQSSRKEAIAELAHRWGLTFPTPT